MMTAAGSRCKYASIAHNLEDNFIMEQDDVHKITMKMMIKRTKKRRMPPPLRLRSSDVREGADEVREAATERVRFERIGCRTAASTFLPET